MLLQSPSQITSLPKHHISHEQINKLDNVLIGNNLEKPGMADGNETGNTMMIEHETRTKLSSPPASSTPPSPESPKSSLQEEKTSNRNSDHNGNAAADDNIVKDKSHSEDTTTSIPTTQSMTPTSFSFQSLMGALGSLPPAMATAAFQALANMSPGSGYALPPTVLAALPPEMATILQQLSAGPHQFGGGSQHSPSSLSSDTVSSVVGDPPTNERTYHGKSNNNNDIPVIPSPPLSRQKLNASNESDEQNETEAAPDTPPSSIPGKYGLSNYIARKIL